jgi:hypothetical protein
MSNRESSKSGDPDLKYSTGVLHRFPQEETKQLIALEIHKLRRFVMSFCFYNLN